MPVSNEAGSDPAFPSNVNILITGNPLSSINPAPVTGTVAVTSSVLSSLQFDGSNNLKVALSSGSSSSTLGPIVYVDVSGTITVGGTAQQLIPASPTRVYWRIQNNSAGDIFHSLTGTAVVGAGYRISAGSFADVPFGTASGGAISIIGATTGQQFSAQVATQTGATATTVLDRSTTVNNTAAITLAPANAARIGLMVQNNSIADVWLSNTGTAAVGVGYRITAGSFYENTREASNAISLIGTTVSAQSISAGDY